LYINYFISFSPLLDAVMFRLWVRVMLGSNRYTLIDKGLSDFLFWEKILMDEEKWAGVGGSSNKLCIFASGL